MKNKLTNFIVAIFNIILFLTSWVWVFNCMIAKNSDSPFLLFLGCAFVVELIFYSLSIVITLSERFPFVELSSFLCFCQSLFFGITFMIALILYFVTNSDVFYVYVSGVMLILSLLAGCPCLIEFIYSKYFDKDSERQKKKAKIKEIKNNEREQRLRENVFNETSNEKIQVEKYLDTLGNTIKLMYGFDKLEELRTSLRNLNSIVIKTNNLLTQVNNEIDVSLLVKILKVNYLSLLNLEKLLKISSEEIINEILDDSDIKQLKERISAEINDVTSICDKAKEIERQKIISITVAKQKEELIKAKNIKDFLG